MNKLILVSMLVVSTLTSFANKGNENNMKENNIKDDNIVQTIAQEYEINSKHISYNNIKNSIYDSGIFNSLKKTISFDFGREYERAFGSLSLMNSQTIHFQNKLYTLKFNDGSECETFNKDFVNDSYYKIEDIIGHMLLVSVISDIAHYYSMYNSQKNIIDSISILKELIIDINTHNYFVNKRGLFMTEIQSWNLEKIITDYSNKIFSSKLDLYRNVNYNALLYYSFSDFESKLVSKSQELQGQTSMFIPSVQGQVEENLTFNFQKNTQTSFKITAIGYVQLSVYHRMDWLGDWGCNVTLDFSELNYLDISI